MTQLADPGLRLDARLVDICRRYRDAPAVTDSERTLTYSALARESDALARQILASGMSPDEPVAVAVSNRATDITGLLAVWRAGGVAVPIHREAAAAATHAIFTQTGIRFFVNAGPDSSLRPGRGEPVQQISAETPRDRPILHNAAWIVFTSGSTGIPKGVVHAHESYLGKLDSIISEMALPARQSMLVPLHMTFAYAHWVCLTTLLTGGEVVLASPFRDTDFMERIGSGATAMAVVPTMLRRLRPLIERQEGPHFDGVLISGGEILPASLSVSIRSAWPDARIWDVYGLTETATSDFYVRPDDHGTAAGTIGRPAAGISFRIDGATGELQIRSPYIMRGYLNHPELTEQSLSDGYLRTGDQARLRDDGCVVITGRLKDLVNRGGNKISPAEIETSFLGHPDVSEALAAGVPDNLHGEGLHLVVVGRSGAALKAEELLRWARGRMERFKIPDRIHIVSELPVGRTGKADRNLLRELIASGALAESDRAHG